MRASRKKMRTGRGRRGAAETAASPPAWRRASSAETFGETDTAVRWKLASSGLSVKGISQVEGLAVARTPLTPGMFTSRHSSSNVFLELSRTHIARIHTMKRIPGQYIQRISCVRAISPLTHGNGFASFPRFSLRGLCVSNKRESPSSERAVWGLAKVGAEAQQNSSQCCWSIFCVIFWVIFAAKSSPPSDSDARGTE